MTTYYGLLYFYITYIHAVIYPAYYPLLGGNAKLSNFFTEKITLLSQVT